MERDATAYYLVPGVREGVRPESVAVRGDEAYFCDKRRCRGSRRGRRSALPRAPRRKEPEAVRHRCQSKVWDDSGARLGGR